MLTLNSSYARFVALLGTVAVASGAAMAQTTERVSVDSSGVQANWISDASALSHDGRFVAFESIASGLVVGDTNGFYDIFVRDRQLGTTERVSVSQAGAESNAHSYAPAISGYGRFVAFSSSASNLAALDTNGTWDVYVRDLQSGTIECASLSAGGTPVISGGFLPSLSADARFVAFASDSTSLVAGDTNNFRDVFVRDRQNGTTQRVSLSTSGADANQSSTKPRISGGGRFVAFESGASNLVAGDTTVFADIFVRDLQSGTTQRVSVSSGGAAGNGPSAACAISFDGRLVAFSSDASNLVAGDTNAAADVFVHDRLTGSTERASVDSAGVQSDSVSRSPALSSDGTAVAFFSFGSNLVAADTNWNYDVFVHDLASRTTRRLSVDSFGLEANSDSFSPSISANGRFVAFESVADNLVAGDTNGVRDIFVHDRWNSPIPYCTSATTSTGCVAGIAASASPSVAHSGTCSITLSNVEGQRVGIFFYGLGTHALPWCSLGGGSSFLCVKPPTQRTNAQSSGGTAGACDGSLALDWNAFQLAHPGALGNPWAAGDKVFVQGWFRDPPSCKTTSLSNAIELTYQP